MSLDILGDADICPIVWLADVAGVVAVPGVVPPRVDYAPGDAGAIVPAPTAFVKPGLMVSTPPPPKRTFLKDANTSRSALPTSLLKPVVPFLSILRFLSSSSMVVSNQILY